MKVIIIIQSVKPTPPLIGFWFFNLVRYRSLLGQFGMTASMSRKGNCYDNAQMESFWGTLKNELIHHKRFATWLEAVQENREYIEIFYNRQRKQKRLGYPPNNPEEINLEKFAIFTDVSVNPLQRIGMGACLLLPLAFLELPVQELDRDELAGRLCCRRFTETSSTRLELQTLLWGLELYRAQDPSWERGALQLYTDSSCIVGLPGRRVRLEGNGFRSSGSGRMLGNAPLYGDFYAASDELGFAVIKVTGHSRAFSHDCVQKIFSIVDRGARRALKLWLAEELQFSGRPQV